MGCVDRTNIWTSSNLFSDFAFFFFFFCPCYAQHYERFLHLSPPHTFTQLMNHALRTLVKYKSLHLPSVNLTLLAMFINSDHTITWREIVISGECMKAVHEDRRGFESMGDEKPCCTSFFYENYRD